MLYERDDMNSALQEVSPQPGSALLFPHGRDNPQSVWHAGMPVVGGCKYIIRTDVVYSPPTATPQAIDKTHECQTARITPSSHDVSALACADISKANSLNADAPQAGPAWDDDAARVAFRQVDEYELGWIDMAGVLKGLALCGYTTDENVRDGEQPRVGSKQVEELLDGMADEREDSDCLNIDEFCRLGLLVHKNCR